MDKITVVLEMVEAGYYLADETPEHFAERFTLEEIQIFRDAFLRYRG